MCWLYCKKETDLLHSRKRRKRGPLMSRTRSNGVIFRLISFCCVCAGIFGMRSAIEISREMMLERGLHIDHTTIYRWVQRYAPELSKRCRPHLKMCNDSWRVDETYIKVKKQWVYLYRSVDSEENTLDFFFSSTRDIQAAKQFFLTTLAASHASEPRVINVDKNTAYPKAFAELKAEGHISEHVELRKVKYLNNLIEQDHRFIKRLTKPGMGFFSFEIISLALPHSNY
jgi:transposase, IS6 family